MTVITGWPVDGIPEIAAGDDLADLIARSIQRNAIAGAGPCIESGDILCITSKVVSKAEGRFARSEDRDAAIASETVRVVASRRHDRGTTLIVENRLGIVGAAAGVDSSNTPSGTVLLLPVDPDASARRLRVELSRRFDIDIGVIISDTVGRPWRIGQTDIAVGAAGVAVLEDLRGQPDNQGRPLSATMTAVADEITAMADLIKGKTSGRPVAVIRGLGRLVLQRDEPGARSLVRHEEGDLFRTGSAEAFAEGYAAGSQCALPPPSNTTKGP